MSWAQQDGNLIIRPTHRWLFYGPNEPTESKRSSYSLLYAFVLLKKDANHSKVSVAATMALSNRAAAASTSSHVAILRSLANKYHPEQNPEGFVNLAVAENSLMHDELTSYINNKINFQSDVLTYGCGGIGTQDLRSAIASFVQRKFRPRTQLNAENIVCTSGLTNAVESITFAVADTGDGILLARPFYGSFPHIMSERPGVRSVYVEFGQLDPFGVESMEAYEVALAGAAREDIKVRALLLCNPHNPLGRCYSQEFIQALMRFASNHGLHIISDEIYALSAYSGNSFTSILAVNPEDLIDPQLLHCLWGTSKDFGASGIRLGAVISHNQQLLSSIASRGLFTFPSTVADCIVTQMLSDTEFVDQYLADNTIRLDTAHNLVLKFLKSEGIPYDTSGGAGFFLWINLRQAIEQRGFEFHDNESALLQSGCLPRQQSKINLDIVARLYAQKVYLASGDAFGSERPGWFRIIFAHPEEIIKEGLSRLKLAIESGPAKDIPSATVVCLCLCFCGCQ